MLSAKGMGARLRAAREGRGLTQEEVAKQLGITAVGYGNFERGDRQIGLEYLEPLSKTLGKLPAYFLGLSATPGLTSQEDDLLALYRQLPEPLRVLFLETCQLYVAKVEELAATGQLPVSIAQTVGSGDASESRDVSE